MNSYCIQNFGVENYKTTLINIALLTILLIYIYKNKLNKYYGLTKITKYEEYLYYIPLLIASVNIWNGIKITITPSAIIFYILAMLTVGFLNAINKVSTYLIPVILIIISSSYSLYINKKVK